MDSNDDLTRAYEDLERFKGSGWFRRSVRICSVAKAILEPPSSSALKSYRRRNLSITKLPHVRSNT